MTRIAIIATGPSLTRDGDALSQMCDVGIAVKDAFTYAPWAAHVYGYDAKWWLHHGRRVVNELPRAQRWSADPEVADLPYRVRYIPLAEDYRLSTTAIPSGHHSGFQALCLAYVLGATEISLLGFDMRHDGPRTHFFGNHPYRSDNAAALADWIPYYDELAAQYRAHGIKVTNYTRRTALTCFPTAPLNAQPAT